VARSKSATRRHGKARTSRQAVAPAPGSSRRKFISQVLLIVTVSLIAISAWLSTRPDDKPPMTTDHRVSPVAAHRTELVQTDAGLKPASLDELLNLPVDQLKQVDIARMNLLCAAALPGTDNLDVDHALAVLDQWAAVVARETDRHLYRVTDPRYADRYRGSEAHFRAEMLAQVLQQDLGVKYDRRAVGNFSFADPAVAFIHGMIPTPAPGSSIQNTPGGTCASMPVLYVAVGRRLGYPLKLSTTDSHVFVRWDGEDHENPRFRGRFNCETTNGFHRFNDDYYKSWPTQLTERQIEVNGFLESLSPAEELAQFLAARGHHGADVGRIDFAARCYENAYRYDTRRPCYQSWFVEIAMRSRSYKPSTPALVTLMQHNIARKHMEQFLRDGDFALRQRRDAIDATRGGSVQTRQIGHAFAMPNAARPMPFAQQRENTTTPNPIIQYDASHDQR